MKKRFTLIELLVVVAIIGILASMLLPALSQARLSAKNLKCVNTIRQGSLVFSNYFSDFGDHMPPLAGSWGYNYGSWYKQVRDYASLEGTNQDGTYRRDKPVELTCPSDVEGVYTYGYRRFLYATNWRVRFKVWGDTNLSYRVTEMADPSATGLLFDNSYYGDAIYYMRLETTLRGYPRSGGGWNASPQHDGSGFGNSYMDGHAEFVKFTGDQYGAGAFRPDVNFFHRTYWGRTSSGTYLSGYYKYSP